MQKQIALVICLTCVASIAGGCSKSVPLPLNASECQQMKDKQLELMLAELKKEFGSGFEGAKVETVLDCDSLKDQGRVQYDCTMLADTMNDLDMCLSRQVRH